MSTSDASPRYGLRVAVTGATGNIGTALVRRLALEPAVGEIIGIARRPPDLAFPRTRWVAADVTRDDLRTAFDGVDAVVHLAWLLRPSHDLDFLWRTNVDGSSRVARAAADCGVGTLVHASSSGVYSPGPKDRAVDESWPTEGIATSFYSRHKAEVERRLDRLERERPGMRIVRIRPGFVFKKEAGARVRRLFLGPLFPFPIARPGILKVVPNVPGLRVQVVQTDDVAEAIRLILLGDAAGAFNLAASPVLDPPRLAQILGARLVPAPAGAVRALMATTWHLRLQPSQPGWLDLGLAVPIMSTRRAEELLGWSPWHGADDATLEMLAGIGEDATGPTPALTPGAAR
jgi:UDP-glucose 4-epimerase